MKNKMKIFFWLFLFILSLLFIWVEINFYLRTGELRSRWGVLSGTNARDALIGYVVMATLWGVYAIWKAYQNYRGESDIEKNEPDNSNKRF